MEREKPTFDILGRIERERLSRGWSEYALAENSGLTQSTISTWRRRNLQPNVASLEKICSGLGISLSQFFQEEDSVYLTPDQKEILDLWAKHRNLLLCKQILKSSDSGIVRPDKQYCTILLLYYLTCRKPRLCGLLIRTHQSASAKQHPTEVPRYYNSGIVDIFLKEYIKHRTACGACRLPVIRASGQLLSLSYNKGTAVVPCIPVFLFRLIDEAYSLILRLYRPYGCYKPRFLLCYLTLSALVHVQAYSIL